MLVAEYDYDTDIAVQRSEERRIAFAEGIEQGIERGIEQGIERGIEQGFSDGSRQKALETARILKQLGDSVKKIMQATGLTEEEVESI